MQEKVSVYDIIKAKLIEKIKEALEGGETFAWVKPWKGAPYPCSYENPRQPFNSSVNRLFLETGEYLTYWQISKLHEENPEIKIKKGAKQAYVFQSFPVFKKEKDGKIATDDKGEQLIEGFRMRYSREFHISDVAGLKSHFVKEEYVHDKTEGMQLADRLIDEYCEKFGIEKQSLYGSGRAYFQSVKIEQEGKSYNGKISLPDIRQFENVYEYYSTIFHELAHSTKVSIDRGKLSYAQEELVAEVSASLLCSSFGLINEGSFQNNVAYLQSWMKEIEQAGSKDIYFAVTEAKKAADLILEASPAIRKTLFPEKGILENPEEKKEEPKRGKEDGRTGKKEGR